MPDTPATIVWFRQDLRVDDHAAVRAAVERRGPTIPVFIWAPAEEGGWPPGGAARWWLHHSLASLSAALASRGSPLILRRGPSLAALRALIRETRADRVVWSRRYEPAARARDAAVEKSLAADGVAVETFNSALLFEPHEVTTGDGNPYRMYTPFWRACCALAPPAKPQPAPRTLVAPPRPPKSESLAALDLMPTIVWAAGLRESWQPGEPAASAALARFRRDGVDRYSDERDFPDRAGTSRLSPHLHWGEISPRRLWHAFSTPDDGNPPRSRAKPNAPRAQRPTGGREKYLAELGWREFAYHLLVHFPHSRERPLRAEFDDFPWARDPNALRAWQRGATGYPFVDAGMRELWTTGWMHNRVRMVVASFLVKHLRIHWLEGARWFWDTLLDADLANNTLGWQWSAGCGADAAPYFRVFNPTLQGRKFDRDGCYVRTFVPALASAPRDLIHEPWGAPPLALTAAGIELGRDYPRPIVEHAAARSAALFAYQKFTRARAGRSCT
ncbi:MAG: deoxyribodipyrimidine photo-lyase [Phycisphaerae bacterium]